MDHQLNEFLARALQFEDIPDRKDFDEAIVDDMRRTDVTFDLMAACGADQELLRFHSGYTRLMNKLKSNCIPKVHLKPNAFQMRENIEAFIKAATAYGIETTEIFETVDLFEAKDIPKVVTCLLHLRRLSIEKTKAVPILKSFELPRTASVGSSVSGISKRTSAKRKSNQAKVFFRINGKQSNYVPFSFVNYEICGQMLGRGNFGIVYKAHEEQKGRLFAIKRIAIVDCSKEEVHDVMKEVDLLRTLRHENIISFHEYIIQDDYVNIVLDFMDGGSLLSRIKTFGTLTEEATRHFTRQILLGLEYLHSKKVVHRDLKAANVLTDSQGRVKLSDFGVSEQMKHVTLEKEQKKNTAAGTPYWMAPEVIKDQRCEPVSDIWSLGCTVVEMQLGKPPLYGKEVQHAMYTLSTMTELFQLPEGISKNVECFVRKCLVIDSKKRPGAQLLLKDDWLDVDGTEEIAPAAEPEVHEPQPITREAQAMTIHSSIKSDDYTAINEKPLPRRKGPLKQKPKDCIIS